MGDLGTTAGLVITSKILYNRKMIPVIKKMISKCFFQHELSAEDRKTIRLAYGFAILFAAVIIIFFTKPIIYDQVIAQYALNYYPGLSSGIISHLVIGIYNTINHPPAETQNIHIKILAMIFFMAGLYGLSNAVLKNKYLIILMLLLVMGSRYPFLWLSSELLTGAFLFFALTAIIRRSHPLIIAGALSLVCFSKPDLIIVSTALLIYCIGSLPTELKIKNGATLLLGFLFFVCLIIAPGIYQQGKDYFAGSNRSLFSFGQHYADLVSDHQIMNPAPDPWENYQTYLNTNFKGAESIFEIWKKYPMKYFDFLCLSAGHGLLKMIKLFHFFLLLLGIGIYYYIKGSMGLSRTEKVILISFLGFLPLVMFAYPHIRYFARFYPLVLLLIMIMWKRLYENQRESYGEFFAKYSFWILVGVGVLGLSLNLFLFGYDLYSFEALKDFWFPD